MKQGISRGDSSYKCLPTMDVSYMKSTDKARDEEGHLEMD